MIKNIVFDNGGVIVKYSADTYLDYFQFPKHIQKTLDQLFISDKWIDFAKGQISSNDFKNYAIQKFPQLKEEIIKILDVNNLKFMIPPYQQTINFIHFLKEKGFNVFLLSDINEDTIKYLNKTISNFESLFNGIIYSCRVGMVKKEGLIFNKLLNDFKLNSEETLFLDDSIINLIEAEKYGINTYRFLDPDTDINNIKLLLNVN